MKTFFLLAALLIAHPARAEVIYYHTDALGTPVVATNEQGQVIWRESYTPHGTKLLNQAAAQTESRGFTGHVHDKVTGLTDMGARWYDPELGRFMGVDPKGFRQDDPHSFNPYVYANNNPYKYVDPDGKVAETVLDIVSLGLSIAEYNADPTIWNGIGLTYDIIATAAPFIPAGFGIIKSGSRAADALRGADAGAGVTQGRNAAEGADKTIFRIGTSRESPTRLNRKAQEAESKIGTHGVSGSTTKPDVACSSATCSALEDAGFKVKSTPTRRDPGHVTIELPKPVTRETADKFNDAFGR